MKPENVTLLEKHKHHHDTLVNAQYLRGLNQHEKNDLLKVAREEFFGSNYNPDMWCGECIMEMVKSVYSAYSNYLKSLPKQTKQSKSF